MKTVLFAACMAMIGADAASAWDRKAAPIEFATRTVRGAGAEAVRGRQSQPAVVPSVRATPVASRAPQTDAPDQPEILYGYGRTGARQTRALLDLRGALRATPEAETLADNAFDDVPPTPSANLAVLETAPQEQPDAGEGLSRAASPVEAAAPQSAAAPPPAALAQVATPFFIQVGAFADPANAERVREALQDVGPVTIEQRLGAASTLHRVRVGQWPTRAAAELACDMIVERGFAGAIVSGGR